MILRLPLKFEGSKGEKNLYALFDSGAVYSYISPEYALQIAEPRNLHTPLQMATASDQNYMTIEQRTTLDFYHEDLRLSDEFLIVPHLSEQVIIGATTMQKWRIKLDFEHDTIIVDPKVEKLILINLITKN